MFKHFRFQTVFVFFNLMFFISACAPISGFKAKSVYLPSQERELSELKKTQRLFNQMEDIDVALHLSKKDFSTLFKDAFNVFSADFKSVDAKLFSKPLLNDVKLHFSKQQLVSQIGFVFEVPSLKRDVSGYVNVEHELQAGVDEFIINTKLDKIIIEGMRGDESRSKNMPEQKELEEAAKSFYKRLQEAFVNAPLRIRVNMNILEGINGKDIVYASDYKFHSAKAVSIQTKMQLFVPYIDANGVIFFGASQLKENTKEAALSDDIAFLSSSLKKEINLKLSDNMGISLPILEKYSSYYIGKAYLAKQMNFSFSQTDLRIIKNFFLKIADENKNFTKDIYFFDKDRLPSCEGRAQDCSKQLLSCNRHCSETYGIHRCVQCEDMSNPFEKVRCMSKLEACKSKEELHTYACNKEEDKCVERNANIQAQCEIKNLNLIAECEQRKEKLLFVNDEIVLAQLQFGFDIDSSYAVQRIRSIVFDKALEHVEVVRDMHISVDSRLKIELRNNSNEDMLCSLGIRDALLTHSEQDYVDEKRELSLLRQRLSDGKLILKAISKPNFISSHLKNPPFDALAQSDRFSLECRYQDMPMPRLMGDQLLKKKDIPYTLGAIMGDIELEFAEEELSFTILPVKVGKDILLYPTMENQAIGFSRQASFY